MLDGRVINQAKTVTGTVEPSAESYAAADAFIASVVTRDLVAA
jgi:hypothetical protein